MIDYNTSTVVSVIEVNLRKLLESSLKLRKLFF